MKIVISDEQFSKIIEEQLQKISTRDAPSDYLGKGREFEKSLAINKKPLNWLNFKCIPSQLQILANYVVYNQDKLMRELNVNKDTLKMLTKIAISIIGRETNFNQNTSFKDDVFEYLYAIGMGTIPNFAQEMKNKYNRLKGSKDEKMSLGPAQFTKETWDKYGLDTKIGPYEKSFTVLSQGIGVIYKTYELYKNAIAIGAGTGPSVNPIAVKQGKIKSINGTGNNSLDLAIASHNMAGLIEKWCYTNSPDFAGPCSQKTFKPYEQSKPNFMLTVYQNKPIPNYFPNKGSGKLTSIGYVEEVASNIKKLNCFNL